MHRVPIVYTPRVTLRLGRGGRRFNKFSGYAAVQLLILMIDNDEIELI